MANKNTIAVNTGWQNILTTATTPTLIPQMSYTFGCPEPSIIVALAVSGTCSPQGIAPQIDIAIRRRGSAFLTLHCPTKESLVWGASHQTFFKDLEVELQNIESGDEVLGTWWVPSGTLFLHTRKLTISYNIKLCQCALATVLARGCQCGGD